jgi:hypothetical protein
LEIADSPPTKGQGEWLDDPGNWPDEDEIFLEKAQDSWSRNYTLAMMIADKEKEAYMCGEAFDYGGEVEGIVTEIFGGKERRRSLRETMLVSRENVILASLM